MLRGERIMEGRGGGKRGIVEGRKDDEGRGDRVGIKGVGRERTGWMGYR